MTPEADRMGVRLDGPELKRNETHDLLSEAVALGNASSSAKWKTDSFAQGIAKRLAVIRKSRT